MREDVRALLLARTYLSLSGSTELAGLVRASRVLKSPAAHTWLRANCQRAARGYLRLQSQVLKRMPLLEKVVRDLCTDAATLGQTTYPKVFDSEPVKAAP